MADNRVLIVGASDRTGQRVTNALKQHGFPFALWCAITDLTPGLPIAPTYLRR